MLRRSVWINRNEIQRVEAGGIINKGCVVAAVAGYRHFIYDGDPDGPIGDIRARVISRACVDRIDFHLRDGILQRQVDAHHVLLVVEKGIVLTEQCEHCSRHDDEDGHGDKEFENGEAVRFPAPLRMTHSDFFHGRTKLI